MTKNEDKLSPKKSEPSYKEQVILKAGIRGPIDKDPPMQIYSDYA